MERDERYEVNSQGSIVVGTPVTLTPSEKKNMIEKMFSINGWTYTLLEEITSAHYYIELKNENLQIEKRFHLFHGNVRKEDPERNREEKKIQLGTENDPRQYFDDALILGFYVYENKNSLADTIIVAWPIEERKNYPANPSLRVNMRTDVMPAKNAGYYVDKSTGKNLVAFRPEFIYHYIENYKDLHYGVVDTDHDETEVRDNQIIDESIRLKGGANVLLYGVPGCGKSFTIMNKYCKDAYSVERVVFHPDYTYGDFVGQILPLTDAETGKIRYEFSAGPFTRTLSAAYNNPDKKYCLIVEEINRGNAPAIFGDIFQMLDREEDGSGAYEITNADVAAKVYIHGEVTNKVKLPSNLHIFATMNTSDQNVFTLDTAFQRRWNMRMVENDVFKSTIAGKPILDTSIKWAKFADTINSLIISKNIGMTSSEDKRLGAYFVTEKDLRFYTTADGLTQDEADDRNNNFPEKVLKYLWDDAFKFTRDEIFKSDYDSLEKLIKAFETAQGDKRFSVFADDIFGLNQEE